VKYYYTSQYFFLFANLIYSWCKAEYSALLLQSSVSTSTGLHLACVYIIQIKF